VKFDECLKLKPNDRGVLFNWGNALYRQARMYEFEKNNEMANKLYGLASEKYLTAMNIKANSLDALYNWGKVLQSQACIEGDYATSQDFIFAVTYYFEVFKNVAIKCKSRVLRYLLIRKVY
jgi:tetratricopeptide (TPR) repeat protein